jgi:hypothetical protein
MASGLTTGASDRLVNASTGAVAHVAPTTPMKLALATATSSASAAGTEVTGGSYARQTFTPTTASGGTGCNNSAAITYTNMPAATTTYGDIYDSNGTPRREAFGSLSSSKTTNAGDTLTFPIASVTYNIT